MCKKMQKRLVAMLLACACTLTMGCLQGKETVEAKVKYETKKIDHSQTFDGTYCSITVENYYEYVQLKGSSNAIKKINKTLKNIAVKTMENESGAVENAAEECNDEYRTTDTTYEDYTSQSIAYQSKKVISFCSMYYWYAGGVANSGFYGYVFDLKTGKQIKDITKVTKQKSLSKIKKTLVKKILASDEYLLQSEVESIINSKKASEFDFYLNKNGNVVVCFGPYELGYGGWGREFVLTGAK